MDFRVMPGNDEFNFVPPVAREFAQVNDLCAVAFRSTLRAPLPFASAAP
jgi:hypothetical protein